jgi:hypothetical protein
MAVINLSSPLFYAGGVSGVSPVVGYESLRNRVARYTFQAPSQGASGINFTFSGNSKGNGIQPTEFYFYVGTSPNSHEDAGADYEHSGVLSNNGNYIYSGRIDMVFYPNKTYYLWVFPTTRQFGWVFWGSNVGDATAESFGAAFSTIDRQEGTIGEEMSIRVNRYDTNYRHTVVYEFGGESGTLCEYSPEENIRWTPPIDLLYQTPNSDKKSGRIIITTYDRNSVEIGSWESELSLSVPDWVVPSVSATLFDKTNAKPTFGVFVQGVSVVGFTVESSGAYGSSIIKIQRYIGGVEYNDLPVSSSGNITASVVVTDSRGRISSYEETIFIQEYQFPQISISASRCDQDGTPNEAGEYANVVMNLKSYQINGINEAFVDIQYGDNSVKVSVVVGERTVNEIVPAPSVSPIRISATLTDLLSSSEPATMVLSIGYATMDFFAGGKGIAFGTTATQDGFTCAMPAHFTGGMSIGNNALTDFVVEQGTSGIWFYRKWNSGLCELFGRQNVRKYIDYGMRWSADYPFTLKTIYSATATNNYAAGGELHGWIQSLNAKVEVTTTGCTVYAQNTMNVLSDGNAWSVSAAIVGTWK